MKIAYIFATPCSASYKLGRMILPQLEAGTCDTCALERNLAEGEPRWCDAEGMGRSVPGEVRTLSTVVGVQVGCFPDLYSALAANPPDQVVTL